MFQNGVKETLNYIKKNSNNSKDIYPKTGFIGMGRVDENWGWLSTYFLNRTTHWEFDLIKTQPLLPANGQMENLLPLLNLKQLIMLIVNQHTNVSSHTF